MNINTIETYCNNRNENHFTSNQTTTNVTPIKTQSLLQTNTSDYPTNSSFDDHSCHLALPLLLDCSDRFYPETNRYYRWKMNDAAKLSCLILDRMKNQKSIFLKNNTEEIQKLEKTKYLLKQLTIESNEKKPLPTIESEETLLIPIDPGQFSSSQIICSLKVNKNQTYDLIIYSALNSLSQYFPDNYFFNPSKGQVTTGCFIFQNIPPELITELQEKLTKLNASQHSTLAASLNSILKPLEQYHQKASSSSHFIKTQRTSNGAFKAINGLCLDQLGKKLFKQVTLEMKLFTLMSAYQKAQKEGASLDIRTCEDIKTASMSLMQLLYKNRNQSWLCQEALQIAHATCQEIFEKMDTHLKSILPKQPTISTTIESIKSNEDLEQNILRGIDAHNYIARERNETLKEHLSRIQRNQKARKHEEKLDSITTVTAVEKWEDLQGALDKLSKSLKNCDTLPQTRLSSLMIFQHFFEVSYPLINLEKNELSSEDAAKCIQQLNEITCLYQQRASQLCANDAFLTKVTLLNSLALAHRLALMVDKKSQPPILKDFGINIDPYKEMMKQDPFMNVQSVDLFHRYQQLIIYFDKFNSNKKYLLCNFLDCTLKKPANHPEIALLRAYNKSPLNHEKITPETNSFLCCFHKETSSNAPYPDLHFLQNLRMIAFSGITSFSPGNFTKTYYPSIEISLKNNEFTYQAYQQKWDSHNNSIQYADNGLKGFDLGDCRNPLSYLRNSQSKEPVFAPLKHHSQFSCEEEKIHPENAVIQSDVKESSLPQLLNMSLAVADVQTTSILEILHKNIDLLKDQKNQRMVELALFKVIHREGKISSPLFDALVSNPSLFTHLDLLTQKALQLASEIGRNPKQSDLDNLSAFLFIINIRTIILKNCTKMKIARTTSEEIEHTLSKALEELEAKAFTDQARLHFRLTRLAYSQTNGYKALNPEQIAQVLSDFIFIKSHVRENIKELRGFDDEGTTGSTILRLSGDYSDYFLGQLSSITLWRDSLHDHVCFMSEILKTNHPPASEIIEASIKKIIGESVEKVEWTNNDNGWFSAKSKQGNWKVNLLLGEWITPYGLLTQYNQKYEKDSSELVFSVENKRLFPKPPNEIQQSGSYIYFQDPRYGSIRCNLKTGTIEREIQENKESHWLLYVDHSIGLGNLPLSVFVDHSIWIRSDGNQIRGIASDLKSGRTLYRIENGEFFNLNNELLVSPSESIFTTGSNLVLCSCLSFQERLLLQNIDPSVRLCGKKVEDKIVLHQIEFPRYRNSNGETSSFIWNDQRQRWEWTQDPQYYLDPRTTFTLGEFAGYLLLKNDKDKRKLIVPDVALERKHGHDLRLVDPYEETLTDGQNGCYQFHVFDLEGVNHYPAVDSLTTEQKLFFIHLSMAHRHYKQASHYLESLSTSDTIGEPEKRWINYIIHTAKHLKDLSPDARAIQLAVYAFAAINDPTTKNEENLKFIVPIYLDYLQHINHTIDPLVLSTEIEMNIIEDLYPFLTGQQGFVSKRYEYLQKILKKEEKKQASIHPEKVNFSHYSYEEKKIFNDSTTYTEPVKAIFENYIEQINNEYKLKEGITVPKLIEVITKQSDSLKKKIDQLKIDAIALAFYDHPRANQNLYRHAYQASKPSLNSYLHAAVRKDFLQAFQTLNPSLSEEQAKTLRQKCIEYMIDSTDEMQLQRAIQGLKAYEHALENSKQSTTIQEKWNDACKELMASRPFDPLTSPFSLLFEMISALRIRQEQKEILDKIFESCLKQNQQKLSDYLFKLQMAGGKTTVIISTILELMAYQDYIPMIVSHHSQFAFAKGTIRTLQNKRFSKDLISLDFRISDLNKTEVLKNILAKLRLAVSRKAPVIMKNSLLQTIELKRLLDLENSLNATTQELAIIEERIKLLEEISSLVEKSGLTILDECHLTLSIKTEVNVPEGIPEPIPYRHVDLIRYVFELISTPPLQELVKIEKNEQAFLSATDYSQKLLPNIIDHLLNNHDILKSIKGQESSFKRYIKGEMDDNPNEEDLKFIDYLNQCADSDNRMMNELADLCAICKILLSDILPSTLGKTHNRAFGRMPSSREGKVIPYIGNGMPAHTQFGNHLETLCYQFMTALASGITASQIQVLYEKAYESASIHARNYQIDIDETEEAKEFLYLTGFSLKSFKLEQTDDAVKEINTDRSKKLLAEMELSRLHVSHHPLIFRSNPVNMMEQMALPIACSGTVGNPSYYSRFKNSDLDDSDRKKINETYFKRASEDRIIIHESDSKVIENLLKNVLDKHPRQGQVRSLIDAGGFFDKYQNIEVAKAILNYCKESTHLKEIQGVVFLHRDSKTGFETFALLYDPQKPFIPLKDTTPNEIAKHVSDPSKIFAFFDELRTTGTDITLAPDAVNLLTVDGKSMTLSTAHQATLRARRFMQSQDIDFIVLSQGKKYFKNEGRTVQDIVETLEENEKRQMQERVYRVYRAKIANIFRKTALEMVKKAKNFKQKQAIYREMKPFLVEPNQNSPYRQYGQLTKQTDTLTHLKQYASTCQKQFLENCSKMTDVFYNKTHIEETLPQILKEAESDVESGILARTVKSTTSNDKTDEMRDCEVEIEKEKALEVQFEQEREKLLEQDLDQELFRGTKTPYIEKSWQSQSCLSFKQMAVNCIRAQDCIESLETKKIFPKNLHLSINFRHTFTSPLPFTHKFQKRAQHILVVKDQSQSLQCILISKKDAAFFQKLLNENSSKYPHLSLFDLNGFPQTLSSEKNMAALNGEEIFQQTLWYANLLAGRVDYLEKHRMLSEKIFQQTSPQEAFKYLLEKTRGQEKARVLQSDLFRSCQIEKGSDQVFYFSYRYRTKNNVVTPIKIEPPKTVPENPVTSPMPKPTVISARKQVIPTQKAQIPWYESLLRGVVTIITFPFIAIKYIALNTWKLISRG